MSSTRRIISWVAACLLGAASFSCAAQTIDGNGAYVSGVAITSDGSILFGGQFSAVGGLPRPGLARVHSDGRLDTSFNPALPASSRVDSLALQADGKVIVGGYFPDSQVAGGFNALMQLNADGSLGTMPAQPNSSPNVLYVQSDGKILVGGGFTSFSTAFNSAGIQGLHYIARLNTDLTLDSTFLVFANAQSAPLYPIKSFAEQSNGSILISGTFDTISDSVNEIFAYSLARVDANGNVDAGFTFPVDYRGTDFTVNQVNVLPSGKILAGGYYNLVGVDANGTTTVSLHNSDGSLDSTDFTMNTLGGPSVMTVQSDGKILLGGVFSQIGNASNSLARNNIGRLNANGLPDSQFVSVTTAGGTGQFGSIVEQADARIVISGSFTSVDNQARDLIARLLSNGALDPTFNVNDDIFTGNFDP